MPLLKPSNYFITPEQVLWSNNVLDWQCVHCPTLEDIRQSAHDLHDQIIIACRALFVWQYRRVDLSVEPEHPLHDAFKPDAENAQEQAARLIAFLLDNAPRLGVHVEWLRNWLENPESLFESEPRHKLRELEVLARACRDASTAISGSDDARNATPDAAPKALTPRTPSSGSPLTWQPDWSSGPEEDPHDKRFEVWMGKRIHLGEDTVLRSLFRLLAERLGVPRSVGEIQRAIQGFETMKDMPEDEVRKTAQRVRSAISRLRAAMRAAGLDDHFRIETERVGTGTEYSMVRRFPR